MTMKLWLLSQEQETGYDTYDSAVVAAPTESQAKRIDPGQFYEWSNEENGWLFVYTNGRRELDRRTDWANDLDAITVKMIGEATPETERGVICASFNAG